MPGESKIVCDDKLGGWKNEIHEKFGENAIIKEFVGGGYVYSQLFRRKSCVHTKPIYSTSYPTQHTHMFICSAKCYGLRIELPNGESRNEIRVKGIMLKSKAATEQCSFDRIKELVLGQVKSLNVDQFSIMRDRQHRLFSNVFTKQICATSKRGRDNDDKFSTVPFGYYVTK